MTPKLIVFVRAPQPGQVKTRLARALGAEAAADAYKILMDQLFENLKSLQKVELRFTPDEASDEFARWLRPGWRLAAQGSGGLGERLARAFQESFATGNQPTVVIGSDCPTILPEDIASAWHLLAANDVTLGPAKDGGYWLIGLRKMQLALFENIPWSTGAVLTSTLRHASTARLKVQLLHTMGDIDTVEDWMEFTQASLPNPRAQ